MRALNALMDRIRLSPNRTVIEIQLMDEPSSDLPVATLSRRQRFELIPWLVNGVLRALALDEAGKAERILFSGKAWGYKYGEDDFELALMELAEIIAFLATMQ